MLTKKIKFLSFLFIFFVVEISADVRDNFYTGLSLLESFNHFSLRTHNTSTQIFTHKEKKESKTLGSFFVGYGYSASWFYVGGELGTYFPKRSVTIYRQGVALLPHRFVNKIYVQDYLTADVLIGGRIKSFLVNLRLGGGFGKIKLHQDENDLANTPSFNADKIKLLWRLGANLNYALTKHFGLAADYIYSHYNEFKTPWEDYNLQFIEKTHSHYVGLSASYSF